MLKTSNITKENYLSAKQSQGLSPDRVQFGSREITTLKLLAAEIGWKTPQNARLMDLGCADKYLMPSVVAETWQYLALDYSDVDFEQDRLPIADDSIDIAVSLAVIEHLREPDLFMSEIVRCLRPGALVYISTPNFRLDFKNFYNDPTHVRPYTPESLEQLLKLHGLINVATFPGLRCKPISWYRGKYRFLKAFYLLPFRNDTAIPAPTFLRGHARSIFGLGIKPI